MKKRILIVGDDQTGESLSRALADRGFSVTLTESANDGYRQVVDGRFDLIMVNLDRAITGAGLIKCIRSHPGLSQLRILTIAAWGTGQATLALSQGADAFEPKPVVTENLVDTIERLLQPGVVMTAGTIAATGDLKESKI